MKEKQLKFYRGKRPRMVLAVIGGAIKSSSIISSVSSSPVSEEEDLVGDWREMKLKASKYRWKWKWFLKKKKKKSE